MTKVLADGKPALTSWPTMRIKLRYAVWPKPQPASSSEAPEPGGAQPDRVKPGKMEAQKPGKSG